MPDVPRFNLKETAILLCQYTERRNYARDAQRRSREFEKEVGYLISSLQESIGEIADQISSHYTIHLDTSTTFGLFLREDGAEGNLVECYIDTSSPPKITLAFRGQGVEKPHEGLVLAPGLYAPSTYLWYSRTKRLFNTDLLAQFCVDQLFKTGIAVLRESTENDPVRELQGE